MDADKQLLILGSTGSIGTQALDIIRHNPAIGSVYGLSANSNWQLLARQINEFEPAVAYLADPDGRGELEAAISHNQTRLISSEEELLEEVRSAPYDLLLNALVGFAGFRPTFEALHADRTVALANKESLVVGGELLSSYCRPDQRKLIPVDSEHSAILQCLVGERPESIEQLIITASGGPFRDMDPERMKDIRVEDALKHPNWDMGAKITIDSATMMNKGLELIEAHWLFDLPLSKIDAVIHPQSIIHSMVTFVDGSTKSQMGLPDMKVPIQYAITYPERLPLETPRVDWKIQQHLTFQPVGFERFPCFKLALDALSYSGHAPAVLNAANEVAVQRFLNKEIRYDHIARVVEEALTNVERSGALTPESLQEADSEARTFANNLRINHA